MGIGFMKHGMISYVTVTVLAGTGGTAAGGVKVTRGKRVTITASPSGNYNFSGWYVGNTRLSTAATYTFVAMEDITIQARFVLKPGAPGSVVEFPYACSADNPFHWVYVETYDYGGREPVSVTITQEYDTATGKELASPVTIPTKNSGIGQSTAGVKYTLTSGASYYCYHSRAQSTLHSGYYRLGYYAMAKTDGASFCKAYRINF